MMITKKGDIIFKRYCNRCGYEEILDKVSKEENDKEYEEFMQEIENEDEY